MSNKPIHNPDHITILMPTRQRTVFLKGSLDSLEQQTADKTRIDLWLYIDHDDVETLGFIERGGLAAYTFKIHQITGERTGSQGEMVNILWRRCSSGAGIYIPLPDDYRIVTAAWDRIVRDAFNHSSSRILLLQVDEPTGAPGQVVLFILSAEWINHLGRIVTDYFPYWFDDTWLDEVSQQIGQRIKITLRMEPQGGKGKTIRMRNLPFWHKFYLHMADERKSDAEKLRCALYPPDSQAYRRNREIGDQIAAKFLTKMAAVNHDAHLRRQEALFRADRSDVTSELESRYRCLEQRAQQILLAKAKACLRAGRQDEAEILLQAIGYAQWPLPEAKILSALANRTQPSSAGMDRLIPPEIRNDSFYETIRRIAAQEDIRTILEIGASSGQGSTEALAQGISRNPRQPVLHCIEVSRGRFDALRQRYADHPQVRCHNASSVPLFRFPKEAELARFYNETPTALTKYPLEQVLGWLRQDIAYVAESGVAQDGIARIRRDNSIETFDMVLIDGSEFTGSAELDELYGARFILLDDINTFKNWTNYQRLKSDPAYVLLEENHCLRHGYAVFKRQPSALHFFTIVLNGLPFLEYHIDVMKRLRLPWHWHIIEGVADLTHDTGWGKANGGHIPNECHRNGLSTDGTSAYLDRLAQEHAGQITLYRPPQGRFWDGKLAMVNAPLPNLPIECLLWQIDSDELWTAEQILRMHAMFMAEPRRTAAHFQCHFFVGPELVTITPNAYSHNTGYEWFRVWRFQKGMRWQSHEPPRLMVAEDGQWHDVAHRQPFTHKETEAAGLVFTHYAYALESQVRFKQAYYGYKGAVEQWRRLQKAAVLPVRLKEYLAWVKDGACVDRVEKRTMGRAVAPVPWCFEDLKLAAITFENADLPLTPTLSPRGEGALTRKPNGILANSAYLSAGNGQAMLRGLHIVIDGVIFQLQHKRPLGIARVWQNLLPELVKALPQARFTVLERRGFSVPFDDLPRHTVNAYVLSDESRLDNDDEMLRQVCSELQADLFVSTYYTRAPGFTNLLLVHDLIPELMGHDLTQPEWRSKIRAIETADGFAAVSQRTIDDLIRYYPHAAVCPVQKMYLGFGERFGPVQDKPIAQLRVRHNLPDAYLLMVGNRRQYKNSAAMWACMQSSQWDGNVQVLCVGGERDLNAQELELVQAGRVRFIPRLQDEELAAAYAGALALVCLSRYEGFGLPVLEAMACGCPVITTANGSLPEVVGDAALFVDADKTSKLLAAIIAVRQPECRRDLIAKGYAQSARFNWTRSAQAMAKLIGDVQGRTPVLVSAIVSTYNSERFMRGCLEDLLAQTMADRVEIIVIDSASTQNEGAVVREFQTRGHRIKYVRTQKRESVYAAWNRGIKLAQGRYVTNANTDDRHRRDAFEQMVAVLEAEPQTALVYGDVIKTATENESFTKCTPTGMLSWFDWDRNRLLRDGCFMGPQPMWRRAVHDYYGYFDESLTVSSDYDFWLRISQTFDFRRIPRPLGLYLERADSLEHVDQQHKRDEDREVHDVYCRTLVKKAIGGFLPFTSLQRAATLGDAHQMRRALDDIARLVQGAQYSSAEQIGTLCCQLAAELDQGPATGDRIEAFIEKASSLFLTRGHAGALGAGPASTWESDRVTPTPVEDSALRGLSPQGDPIMQLAEKIQKGVHCLIDGGHSEVAQWMLDKLLADNPSHVQAHHERAMLAHRQGDTPTAGLHFQRAAELAPGNSMVQKSLGDFYHVVQGRIDAAIAQYQKVLTMEPNNQETLLTTAHLCVSLRRFEEARQYYQKVLAQVPNHPDACQMLAQLNARQTSLRPQVTSEVLYHTACQLSGQGQVDQAKQTLERLIAADPNHALAHNDLGVLNYDNGQRDQALVHYETACRLAPENGTFHKNLADFYFIERNDAQKALTHYVQALTIDPQDLESLMSTGQICMSLDRNDDARVFFNRVLEIEPWHAQANHLLEQLDRPVMSVVTQAPPSDLYELAQAKAAAGDALGAIQALKQLVAREPNHARAYNDLGVLHYDQGDKNQALRYYEQSVRLAPNDPTFLKNLADFYFVEQNRTEDALRIYIRILESDREDVDSLLAAGTICANLDKNEDARVFFERVLEIDPWNNLAKQALDRISNPSGQSFGGRIAALGRK